MKRLILILTMAVVLLAGASSVMAQEASGVVCEATPQQEWRQYWSLDGAWWWFLWYRDCSSPETGTYRLYEGWDWGPPVTPF